MAKVINFRKLKKEFSPSILQQGKELFGAEAVCAVKIVSMDKENLHFNCSVVGKHNNTYECELEVDLTQSNVIASDCDCPYEFDCQHLAAILFHLEKNFDQIVVNYSQEADLESAENIDDEEKDHLRETFEHSKKKEVARRSKKKLQELLDEYVQAATVLGQSPFFLPEEVMTQDKAELAVILPTPSPQIVNHSSSQQIRLALRLPFRSKPVQVTNAKEFLESVRYHEAIYLGNRRCFFGLRSFSNQSAQILKMLMDYARFPEETEEERGLSFMEIGCDALGAILAHAYDLATAIKPSFCSSDEGEEELPVLPCLFIESMEQPLRFCSFEARLNFELEYFDSDSPKLLLKPTIVMGQEEVIFLDQACLFECAKPGLIYEQVFYRFQPRIRRKHLRHLPVIRDIAVPEPLLGAFVENSMPELLRYAEVTNQEVLDHFVTMPYVDPLTAECEIEYLDGELEAKLFFLYGEARVPAAPLQLQVEDILSFITDEGIVARNLTDEHTILQDLFQGFYFDEAQGVYVVKNDKRIVEFMTEVIPRNQKRVSFHCPKNLLEQFLYDETTFVLSLKESETVETYRVHLEVNGHLEGFVVDRLWDCLASKRNFIELIPKQKGRRGSRGSIVQKILVLDLEKLAPVVQVFDEIGIEELSNHEEERPLWSLVSIKPEIFKDLPIKFSMTKRLKEIQEQMLGNREIQPEKLPKEIKGNLRNYQEEGVDWLHRLRSMYLCGILADDMGLGKTLQAIIAMTQYKAKNPKGTSIVICPTSLIYNWREECLKFNPKLKILPIDGTPVQRKKLIDQGKKHDLIITSYSLLQKDIESYQKYNFGYAILDEAQHIKNRNTRNAKSVKELKAAHRLILTGTPIENSLDELWSLFDFLMPGLLSTYERFIEKYVRGGGQPIEALRQKVAPFILRRMKCDVLKELPPVTEIIYHCNLSPIQKQLYKSFAESAREELSQLVEKEGFEKVQIQVLATLTRLKQICCHPAIFAKENPELGDSSKYDMLLELLHSLIEGNHKTVVFSQYTRMLSIVRDDLTKQGIRFCYLDGSTKNRMSVVKEFNEDPGVMVFLVSLKAGGTGLNLTGADTVIHYDMWWNPAVENQATDRVHRLGQENKGLTCINKYKLVTLGTIEEKILEMQNRKQGLVKEVITSDEDAMSKLNFTWDDIRLLLQT